MKKLTFFSFATLAVLFSSCADLNLVEKTEEATNTIAAVMEGVQTKTSTTDEGRFSWSEGDDIWLETTSDYAMGTLSAGAGTPNATFTYGSFFGDLTGKSVYPYNEGHSVDGDVLNVVLPASYDLGSNLDNTNSPMYGVNKDGTLKFNHLAGVMRFSFKNVPAGVDRFVFTVDKKINGTFAADLTADYPVLQTEAAKVDAERTVTFNFDALASTSDVKIFVPLPLGTYESLELALYKGEESVWTYSKSVTNTINRKSLLLMLTVNVSGSISGELEGGEVGEGENPSDAQEGDYVDEYGINHGQGVEIDGVIWAPVNCGYHATDYQYGKLYQWGRKYGQGYQGALYDELDILGQYSDASAPSIVSGPVSLSTGQSASNTDKFYYNLSSPYDWLSPQDDMLWNSGTDANPVKTEYDPCPEGWRVPTYIELDNLKANRSSWTVNDNQRGYWFSGSVMYSEAVSRVFFPAAGRRGYDGRGGYADNRYYSGNYWSSSTNINASYSLYFKSSTVDVYSNSRDKGYSVRCVREDSLLDVPEGPSDPTPSQPSYSVQLKPSTYGWQQSTSVPNPDPSVYEGVYESTNQGVDNTKSVMYIDINGYQNFTIYIRSNAESRYDYVEVSDLDADISGTGTSGIKVTTSNNQNPGTSLSAYTAVQFTGIDGGQHRIMVTYRKDSSQSHNDDKGYVLIPKNQGSNTPSEPDVLEAVNLSDEGTANSYIVSEAGSYKFTPTKGNSSESVGTIASVEVLWESFGTDVTPSVGSLVSNVRYEAGEIFFNTPETFKEGNAVIAVKDAAGNILWSWHIWFTDQPQGQVYYNNAGTMMDRNLGATSATPGDIGALGLLYQWGRKDPFLGSSSISDDVEAKSTITWPSTVSSDSSNGTIEYVTAHPTTFITENSSNIDWYYTGSSSTDNTRWTTSDKTKSIYDPCPAGWRVPDGGDNGVWSKALGSSSDFFDSSLYNSTNEGMNFSGKFGSASTIWYPASGYRNYLDGSLSYGGSRGYYWSASPDSDYAYYLRLNYNGDVNPSNYYYRALGYSVRCLQE